MLVGALADAGADQAAITDAIASLDAGASVSFEKVQRSAIGATKYRVAVQETKTHRHLSPIIKMIERANLAEPARRTAIRVFRKLADAEAQVHQVPIEKVHFHEVGAADSIADIVGAAVALDLLDVETVICSPINVGSGTVRTEHGMLPVPAPATALLLTGVPVYARGPALELTTPTGAAVAVTLAARFGVLPPMKITATGYGAGDHEFPDHANVLRVILGEPTGADEALAVCVIEANIDDLNPQVLAYTTERLVEFGALDVSLQPVQMKKGRAGTLLRAVAKPEHREAIAQLIFAETSTLGVRIYPAERRVQARIVDRGGDAARQGTHQSFQRRQLCARVRRLPPPGRANRRGAQAHHRRSQLRLPETNQMKYYLTTPLYYVNAAPHIGHTYTTMAAETIARFKRMQGYDAVMFTGTDEHGQKVERSAEAAGKSPQEFTDVISAEFRAQWEKLNIRVDRTIRTTDPKHHKVVQDLFQRCMDNGYVYKGSYTGQYCVSDELYANEAKPGDPCPICGRITETVTEENYFFKLSAFTDKLIELYETHPEFIQPETRRNEVLAFVRQGLNDLSISRTSLKWGIPLPVEGKHVFYVWFDALIGYMSAVDGEGSVAGRPAPDRQGDRALPCGLLAGVPDGGRHAAAQTGLRARLAAV